MATDPKAKPAPEHDLTGYAPPEHIERQLAMEWKRRPQSKNVEDRRGLAGTGFFNPGYAEDVTFNRNPRYNGTPGGVSDPVLPYVVPEADYNAEQTLNEMFGELRGSKE